MSEQEVIANREIILIRVRIQRALDFLERLGNVILKHPTLKGKL